jgi:hypothetical protein
MKTLHASDPSLNMENQMTHLTRKATNRLLEDIEAGLLDRDTVIMACVKYMSEDDVADMCHCNEFFSDAEDETEDDEVTA